MIEWQFSSIRIDNWVYDWISIDVDFIDLFIEESRIYNDEIGSVFGRKDDGQVNCFKEDGKNVSNDVGARHCELIINEVKFFIEVNDEVNFVDEIIISLIDVLIWNEYECKQKECNGRSWKLEMISEFVEVSESEWHVDGSTNCFVQFLRWRDCNCESERRKSDERLWEWFILIDKNDIDVGNWNVCNVS